MRLFGKDKPEFQLENVVEKNRLHPRTFLIPSREEIAAVGPGSYIRLIFVMEKPLENGCRAEKMWVTVQSVKGGVFEGILDNQPVYLKTIKFGDKVTFKVENIASISGGKAPFDEKLLAIITKKALEKRQINWVLRRDERHSKRDSGWELFYGDEGGDYTSDPKNSTLISLEDVLSFEPLLEDVFAGPGHAYEYSEKLNRFVEVEYPVNGD